MPCVTKKTPNCVPGWRRSKKKIPSSWPRPPRPGAKASLCAMSSLASPYPGPPPTCHRHPSPLLCLDLSSHGQTRQLTTPCFTTHCARMVAGLRSAVTAMPSALARPTAPTGGHMSMAVGSGPIVAGLGPLRSPLAGPAITMDAGHAFRVTAGFGFLDANGLLPGSPGATVRKSSAGHPCPQAPAAASATTAMHATAWHRPPTLSSAQPTSAAAAT